VPEGHTINRLARLHRRALRGRTVAVTSPQDRFAAGAALLDGLTSTGVDAYGKHLFYRWSDGSTLHVHLGLYGAFRSHPDPAPPPTAGTRLTMATGDVTLHLAGPTACELLGLGEERRLRERLGPTRSAAAPTPRRSGRTCPGGPCRSVRRSWTSGSRPASATSTGPSCCSCAASTRTGPRGRSRTSRPAACGPRP
jgi:hypothetical protein